MEQTQLQSLKFEGITLPEAEIISEGLGALPWGQVNGLMVKLQKQLITQLQENETIEASDVTIRQTFTFEGLILDEVQLISQVLEPLPWSKVNTLFLKLQKQLVDQLPKEVQATVKYQDAVVEQNKLAFDVGNKLPSYTE